MNSDTESPTKNIRQKLKELHLGSAPYGDKDRRVTSKNHLQIPSLLFNDKFEDHDYDESILENNWDDQDTVIHKTDVGDVSLADFIKVKLQIEQPETNKVKPKLKNTVPGEQNVKPKLMEDDLDASCIEANTTWEALKKNYNIRNEDIYPNLESNGYDTDQTETQLSTSFGFISDDFNKSTFSFQEMPKIKISGSTLHSGVASFQPKYIDSPLDTPKLIKPSLITTEAKVPMNFKVPIKLITPKDICMVFDEEQEKWIRGQQSPFKNRKKTNPAEVTSVASLDISFSESKKALISSLTTALDPSSNWDRITNVNLSNQNLTSLVGLSKFLPSLTHLTAANNKITSFDGISLEIRELNLSHNIICDHLTSISNFKSLLAIDLSNNKISRMDFFKDLPGLKKLNLSHNKIKDLLGLEFIEILDISNNLLSGVLDFKSCGFSYLNELNCSNNKLESIKNIESTELKKLIVNNNELKCGFKISDISLQHLEILGNSNNLKLGSDDELILLKSLFIDGNIELNGKFYYLKELYVNKDYDLRFLRENYDEIFINPKLESLIIDNSGLTQEDFYRIIKKFPFLTKIDLSNNLIRGSFLYLVEFLAYYRTSLKFFNINNNPLVSYLKNDLQKERYQNMIIQVIHDNI